MSPYFKVPCSLWCANLKLSPCSMTAKIPASAEATFYHHPDSNTTQWEPPAEMHAHTEKKVGGDSFCQQPFCYSSSTALARRLAERFLASSASATKPTSLEPEPPPRLPSRPLPTAASVTKPRSLESNPPPHLPPRPRPSVGQTDPRQFQTGTGNAFAPDAKVLLAIAQDKIRMMQNRVIQQQLPRHRTICKNVPDCSTLGMSFCKVRSEEWDQNEVKNGIKNGSQEWDQNIVDHVFIGGPAYQSGRIFPGDRIVALDSISIGNLGEVTKHLISTIGNAMAGAKVEVTLVSKASGRIETVELECVPSAQIADQRHMFDMFVRLQDRARAHNDFEQVKLVDEALEFWKKMMEEMHEHDAACVATWQGLQSDAHSWLSELFDTKVFFARSMFEKEKFIEDVEILAAELDTKNCEIESLNMSDEMHKRTVEVMLLYRYIDKI